MIRNIYAGAMGVIALAAGVYAWWFDNGGSFKRKKQDDTIKEEKKGGWQ